jgi:hypothetical protein
MPATADRARYADRRRTATIPAREEVRVSDPAARHDRPAAVGSVHVAEAAISGAPGTPLGRFATAMIDGIRATGDGHLVVTGLAGVIASIDVDIGVGGTPVLGAGGVRLLYDTVPGGPLLNFDDFTAFVPIPLPGVPWLFGIGLVGLATVRMRWR